ncbi:MAG: hypothetical protein IPG04_23535 [Polyangiaceae bacterium]|nr:hypothetical protein [Polyangiaceae bacterium]
MSDETNAITLTPDVPGAVVVDRQPDRNAPLTRAQIGHRVARTNTLVVGQLFAIQQKRFQDEEARSARLETKANGLIGVNALTLTLVSSVGIGVLLQSGAGLGLWLILVLPVYLLCVVLGLWTGLLALEAVKVREHHKLNDNDIFPDDVLKDADAVANEKDDAEGVKRDREKDGLALYHRFHIMCLSKLLPKDTIVNDQKAADLEKAQKKFQHFLLTVGALAGIAALIAFFRAVLG